MCSGTKSLGFFLNFTSVMKRIHHILFPHTDGMGCFSVAHTVFIIIRRLQILKNEALLMRGSSTIPMGHESVQKFISLVT
jgi:hypothetical protein